MPHLPTGTAPQHHTAHRPSITDAPAHQHTNTPTHQHHRAATASPQHHITTSPQAVIPQTSVLHVNNLHGGCRQFVALSNCSPFKFCGCLDTPSLILLWNLVVSVGETSPGKLSCFTNTRALSLLLGRTGKAYPSGTNTHLCCCSQAPRHCVPT